jgi:hypothetical protein
MLKPISHRCKKEIEAHSKDFLRILGFWIYDKRKYLDKSNEERSTTIGRFLSREKSEMGYKQFADILMACRKATCVDEFKLYILYKGSKENSAWGRWLGEKSLSKYLNDLIDGRLKEIAQEIAAKKELGAEDDFDDIYLAVLEKFLGYLYWGVKVLGADRGNGGGIEWLKA